MTRSTAGPRVLYVDPDDERAAPVVDALRDAGYTPERARDAAAALDAVATDPPAAVVSERRLPDGSGLDLLADVRDRTEDLPFLVFTAVGDEHLASDAIAAGVTDYVPRDPPEKQLGALVDALDAAIEAGDRRFAEVTEELKDRAMDEAPVGITIADGKRRDTPLIYINEAFEELTGYETADVLGRNCNFMQGDDSAESEIAAMATAIDAGEPVTAELVNYTDDGERFWNRVHIAPVRDSTGEVTHYVGFQEDVTERVEAEREAQRQAERARAEREKVEALLDRLDGLVTDVTSELLSAGSRSAVERAVADRLVETEEYALAWVGEAEPATDTIRPGTWAGVADPPDIDLPTDGEDPAARAARTGDAQFVVADAVPSVYDGLVDGGAGGLAALPLQYGDVSYGVLVVGLRTGADLPEPEQRVLAAVAQSTAMALHALTSQRLLGSDDVTELAFSLTGEDPFFVGLSAALDAEFVHTGTVTREAGATTFFFETDAEPEAVVEAASAREDVTACTPVTTSDGRSVVEFTVGESPLVDLLVDRGGRVAAMSAAGGTGDLTVEIPPEAQPRTVVEVVEDRIDGADLSAYREHERPAESRQDVRARIDDRLTDRQSTALQTAIVGGFFEWPRETNGEDLAAAMDIGRSTFHQHLRAAQRKVFEELYG
ncbi:PAS domain-containing protein [Halosimplex rubrum]|uniref:PAS domain-containing protein n=1 Tax=Halosimplex rubrum TaxID=869889 RepID=A0A7D5T4H6_9EURY|nr:bacterio-opsin activator domain-containing protein [Halosimplex rubrum]QLH76095.1 PAS domain-containing protein [Halosimplex rubrum]